MAGRGTITIRILGDAEGFQRSLADVESKLGAFGGKLGKIGLAAGAAVGAAALGAGAALFAIGDKFDGAMDSLRVATGKTGTQLDALGANFKNVVKDVPADFDSAAQAVGLLNQRTGLTGPALEDLSKRMLEVTRLTGGDLETNIGNATRLFGDWGVATKDQAGTLDKLFRASQATGVGIDKLSEAAVTFGAPLRAMGFDLDTTVGLFAKFEKEGVNAELVMGAMRKGLANFAKAGEDAPKALARLMDEVKAAKSPTEGTALAMEVFGSKAGPDMAAAIREGRFELGDLLGTIKGGKDTIMSASADTEDFAEKWVKFKNRVMVALEPLATKVFGAVADAMETFGPVAEGVIAKVIAVLDRLAPVFKTFITGVSAFFSALRDGDVTSDGFVGFMETLGAAIHRVVPLVLDFASRLKDALLPAVTTLFGFLGDNAIPILGALAVAFVGLKIAGVVSGVMTMITAFRTAAAASSGLSAAMAAVGGPVVLIIAGIAALAAGAIYAYQHFEGFRNVVDGVARFLRDTVLPIILNFVDYIVEQFGHLKEWVALIWPQISEAISHVMNVIAGVIRTVVDIVMVLWRAWGDDLLAILKTAWDYIRQTVENAINIVRGVIEAVLAIINGDWGRAWDAIKGVLSAVWDQIKNIISTAFDIIKSLFGAALSVLGQVWQGVWDKVKGIVSGAWDGIKSLISGAIDTVVGFIGSMPGRIASAARGMWDGIKDAFRGAINFIINGWNGINFKIPGFKIGPIGYDGFTLGLPRISPLAQGGIVRARAGGTLALIGEAGRDEAVIPLPRRGGLGGGGGPPVQVYVGGSVISEGELIDAIHAGLLEKRRRGGDLGLA